MINKQKNRIRKAGIFIPHTRHMPVPPPLAPHDTLKTSAPQGTNNEVHEATNARPIKVQRMDELYFHRVEGGRPKKRRR